jgi:hypothetical protein
MHTKKISKYLSFEKNISYDEIYLFSIKIKLRFPSFLR